MMEVLRYYIYDGIVSGFLVGRGRSVVGLGSYSFRSFTKGTEICVYSIVADFEGE